MRQFFGNKSHSTGIKSKDELLRALRQGEGVLSERKAVESFEEAPGGPLVPGIEANRLTTPADFLQTVTSKTWCYARACELVANEVLNTEMKAKVKGKATPRNRSEPQFHPDLVRLLNSPNPFTTGSQLMFLLVMHLKATGTAYWLKDNLNGLKQPENIWPLSPAQTRPLIDRKKGIVGFRHYTASGWTDLEPEDVIYFRRPHPENPLLGWGEIEQGQSIANEFINRSILTTRMMANGGYPSSVMVRETWEGSEEDWLKIKAQFRAEYAGAKNSGKVMFMYGKWSALQLGLDSQKMQELERSKANKEDVILLAGVPLSVFGASNAANYACLPAGELVATPIGPKPIESLKTGDAIVQFDEKNGFVHQVVDAIIPQGDAHVYEILTPSRKLRASDNHPILCAVPKNGIGVGPHKSTGRSWTLEWKKAVDIKQGDQIVTMEEGLDADGEWPSEICGESQVDTAYLMGAYMGDGSGIGARRPLISVAAHKNESGWQKEITRCIAQLLAPYPTESGKRRAMVSVQDTQVKAYNVEMCRRLKASGFGGTCNEKRIPEFVWTLKRELRLAFLAGLIDADGTVCPKRGAICLASSNKMLMEQARDLAISCGIPVSNIADDVQNTNFGVFNYYRFTFGYSDWNVLIPLRHPKKAANVKIGLEKRHAKTTQKFRFGRTKDRMHRPKFKGLKLPPGAGISMVSKVTYLGVMPVYDLATFGSHTFIASGVVTHNTSRQDDISFKRRTVLPLINIIVETLNHESNGLVPLFHKDLMLDFPLSGLVDVEQVMKDLTPLFDRAGITPNQLREAAGLPRVENPLLDQFYLHGVPIELAGILTGPTDLPSNQ
ncbi:MAG: phage portal protein [Opitutaceae bacterium]|nr:phage portal protein [Opitutaceae bacterium]